MQPTQDELSAENRGLHQVKKPSIVQDENDLSKQVAEQVATKEITPTDEQSQSVPGTTILRIDEEGSTG